MNTWTLTTQNSNSPILDFLIMFHDTTMVTLVFITMMILYIMVMIPTNLLTDRFLLHGHSMELIWTFTPMIILILIALPSIKILYMTDELPTSNLTLKTMGHQWYWNYEYSDFLNIEFDSYMTPLSELKTNEFRLLDVDNRCILPLKFHIRILTSSADVIHAWTIPSLGIKMDSTPGRLNQANLYMYRPGLFFGQCSEICGMNHSFMPIVLESTSFTQFKIWLSSL